MNIRQKEEKGMTIQYKIDVRSEYLYFAGEGIEGDLEENKQIHEMIVKLCKDQKCGRVLIDDRNVIYTASISSLYELTKYYATVDLPGQIKHAAVVVNPRYKDTNTFFENAARNRGIDLRIFHRIEDAEAWLIKT